MCTSPRGKDPVPTHYSLTHNAMWHRCGCSGSDSLQPAALHRRRVGGLEGVDGRWSLVLQMKGPMELGLDEDRELGIDTERYVAV